MKRMTIWALSAVLALGTLAAARAANDKQDGFDALQWQQGPRDVPLAGSGKIHIPDKTAALSEDESVKFLKLTGNLPEKGLNIIVGSRWWATFDFDPSGYIKDDEKIDADALLKQLKDSDAPSNEERRKQGLTELVTDGWYVPPHYDAATRRLEWGLRIHSADHPEPVINYTVRVLGRRGYERVVLVSSPETLDRDVAEFKGVLGGFDFDKGEGYSEFKAGDHVAEFGLAALVAGGAAAVATKTGFWKVLAGALVAGWKLVAAACVAVFAGIGKLLGRKRDRTT